MIEENITGKRIKKKRLDKGMTQKDLGERIGVTAATINKYETGITPNLTRSRLQAIAKILDVSEVYLLGITDYPGSAEKIVTGEDGITRFYNARGEVIGVEGAYTPDFKNLIEKQRPSIAGPKISRPVEQPAETEEPSTAFDPAEAVGPFVSSGKPGPDPSMRQLSPQEQELLRIYNTVSVRRQMELLSFAYSLEDQEK